MRMKSWVGGLAAAMIGLALVPSSLRAVQVGVGALGGLGKAAFWGDGLPGGYKTTVPFGLLVDVKLNKWLFIQPEIVALEKGDHTDLLDGYTELRVGGFELPLLLKAVFDTGRADRPFIKVGPYFGFPSAATAYVKTSAGEVTVPIPADRLNATEIGYTVGAGMELYLAPLSFDLELRASRGLTPFLKDPPKGSDAVNSTVSVLLSAIYWFGL